MSRAPYPPKLGYEPFEEDQDSPSPLLRYGGIIGASLVVAIVSSLPAELRIGDGGSLVRAFVQWLALSAIVLPVALFFVAVLRRARAGLLILAGPRAALFCAAALWWAVLELGFLSVLGTILRAKTHHHGLAGVTFAIFALFSGVVVGLLAMRGAKMLTGFPERGHRVALGVAGVAAFVVVLLVGIRTARAEGLHTAAALVDTLALVGFAALASGRRVTGYRPLALGGAPVAALLLLVGFATVRSEPDLRAMLADAAPMHAWVLALFGR